MHCSTVSNTTSHNCVYLTQKRPPNFIFQLERQEEIYFLERGGGNAYFSLLKNFRLWYNNDDDNFFDGVVACYYSFTVQDYCCNCTGVGWGWFVELWLWLMTVMIMMMIVFWQSEINTDATLKAKKGITENYCAYKNAFWLVTLLFVATFNQSPESYMH